MKNKIVDILLKHSYELKVKSSIMNDTEVEEYLWSGEFERVADEIITLMTSDVVESLCNCKKPHKYIDYSKNAMLCKNCNKYINLNK